MWRGAFKKLELDTEYPADPITVWARRKISFLHPLDHQKMQFPKPEKYSTINKSTTFCTFLLSLCQPHKFCIISTQISTIIFLSKKKKKSRVCLQLINICTNYLKLIVQFLNCAVVELSQKRTEFQYQDVLHIKM